MNHILNDLELINPIHLNLISDGEGEFPDSYKLTSRGISLIKETLFEIIKGEIELRDEPKEYTDEIILESIRSLIN